MICSGVRVLYIWERFCTLCPMFIRQTKKQRSKDSKIFYQYSLVQSTRVNGKARQRTILYLGSDEELQDKQNRSMVLDVLKNKIQGTPPIFSDIPAHLYKLGLAYYEKYKIRYAGIDEQPGTIPQPAEPTDYQTIDVNRLEVDQVKSFGPEHLCLQTMEKLQLAEFLRAASWDDKDIKRAMISIISRAIYTSSEHKTEQILDMNSSISGLMRYEDPISYKQLYRISDLLYEHKDQIDKFLYNRITDMFDLDDKIIIYDISNTYFESRKDQSSLATYGRSKEKRSDCPIVVFTGVINSEGFIRHSRIYEGNKPDQNTLSDMIDDLERYSSGAKNKTIVLDAGIASEENLRMLQNRGLKYVCVSRRRLKDYPVECLDRLITKSTDGGKEKVKLSVFTPEGYSDTWMFVQSEAKQVKQTSMQTKLRSRFEEDLTAAQQALHKKGGIKSIDKVWERIGRLKQKHKHVSGAYKISVTEEDQKATAIKWTITDDKINEDKSQGIYFIRTNHKDFKEGQIWDVYNLIREVEATFRCLKSDLNIRPVHHQNDERIEAHIYLTILAYQLVNTIRYMLKQSNIRYDWQNIVRIMRTQTLQTLELHTETKVIHLQKPAKPIKEVVEIYAATRCENTQKAVKKYVVYH